MVVRNNQNRCILIFTSYEMLHAQPLYISCLVSRSFASAVISSPAWSNSHSKYNAFTILIHMSAAVLKKYTYCYMGSIWYMYHSTQLEYYTKYLVFHIVTSILLAKNCKHVFYIWVRTATYSPGVYSVYVKAVCIMGVFWCVTVRCTHRCI